MAPGVRISIALLGAAVFAAAGAVMGSMNAGWFQLERSANTTLPFLGVGAALVVLAFVSTTLHRRLAEAGGLGMAVQVLLVLGPALFILSWLIEFAIFGTLSFAAGLVCLAVAVTRFKLVPIPDRILIILSAAGSFTWNTETVSAFLLVGVGVIWMILSIRLLGASQQTQLAAYEVRI